MPNDLLRIDHGVDSEILEILGGIFGRMIAMHCHYQRQSSKSENQRSLEIAFGWITRYYAWQVYAYNIYTILHIYIWHIVFADALLRRGVYTTLSFCTSHPPHPLHRSSSHSPFPVSKFAVSRVGVIVLRCMLQGQTPTVLRATDSGANVIIFRNLLSRCSPLWSRRYRRRRRRCHSVARGLFFPTHLWQSSTLRYFACVCAAEWIFLHANLCNREIFMPVYKLNMREGKKREWRIYVHVVWNRKLVLMRIFE